MPENSDKPEIEYKQITAIEFRNILAGFQAGYSRTINLSESSYEELVTVIENIEVTESVVINLESISIPKHTIIKSCKFNSLTIISSKNLNYLKIENSIFEGNVTFSHNRFQDTLIISNNTFNGEVTFNSNDIYNDFEISGGQFKKVVTFSNGNRFQGHVLLKDAIFSEGVIFKNESTYNDLLIESGDFNTFGIDGALFTYGVRITGGIFRAAFGILSGEFSNDFVIQGGEFVLFTISAGVFQKPFRISGGIFNAFSINGSCTFNDSFMIQRGEFNGAFDLEGVDFKREFSIYSGVFKGSFTMDNLSLALLRIVNGQFENGFIITNSIFSNRVEITGGVFQKIFLISTSTFNKLNFHFTSLNINCLIINDTITANVIRLYTLEPNIEGGLKQLIFSNIYFPKDLFIEIENVQLSTLYFSNFINYSNIIFSGVNFKHSSEYKLLSNYEIKDFLSENNITPTIDTFQIHNSDLGKSTFIDCDFSEMTLDFISSKITDVFLAGTAMPKEIATADNSQKRLGYGQLKKVYESRGDTVTANEYFSREMNVYYEQLNFRKNFSEKLNIFLNKYSSNHGQDWIRALKRTLLFGLILFAIYCCLIGYTPSSYWNHLTLHNFGYCISNFPAFLNPIHPYDFMKKSGLGNWARLIDGISRIILSYFLYQLIQAFRKHGKK